LVSLSVGGTPGDRVLQVKVGKALQHLCAEFDMFSPSGSTSSNHMEGAAPTMQGVGGEQVGRTVLILGPTGSGKTTTMSSLFHDKGSGDGGEAIIPPAPQAPKTASASAPASTTSQRIMGGEAVDWDPTKAIVSQFGGGEQGIDAARTWLARAGLNSVPSWVKPFHILSSGERFRATLARQMQRAAKDDVTLVVDDFASNLDVGTARCCAAGLVRFSVFASVGTT
jgi:ABC-type ATPase with predicted acetyltransferase domain